MHVYNVYTRNYSILKFQVTNYISIFFHNLSGHETHLFIRKQRKKFNEDEIRLIARKSSSALMSRSPLSWKMCQERR